MSKILAGTAWMAKFLFRLGRLLSWSGAACSAVLVVAFVYASVTTVSDWTLRDWLVSLLVLWVIIVLTTMLAGRIYLWSGGNPGLFDKRELDTFDRAEATPGLYSAPRFIMFLNVAGWLVVPAFLIVAWGMLFG